MGKERDELIKRLGGIPISDLYLTDEEIVRLAQETYTKRGEIPAEIRQLIDEFKKKGKVS